MSTSGIPHSKDIASYALDDANTLLRQREEALKGFRVLAPATGIVERVLIRPGEYNQDAGKPGFIIASGLWFEASLDQRAVALAHLGQEATVILEAYPGRILPAKVERIIPIVTFDAGGPETTRPIRPRGTGSPEWPATFKVRLQIDAADAQLAPGMSGFTRIICHHRGLAVPREAVVAVSAGKGVIRKLAIDSPAAQIVAAIHEEVEGFTSRAADHYSNLLDAETTPAVRNEAFRGALRLAINDFNSGLVNRASSRLEQLTAIDPSSLKTNYALQLADLRNSRTDRLERTVAEFAAVYKCFQSREKRAVLATAHHHLAELDFDRADKSRLGDEMRAAAQP